MKKKIKLVALPADWDADGASGLAVILSVQLLMLWVVLNPV